MSNDIQDRAIHHHYSGEPCEACRIVGRKEVMEWINYHFGTEKGQYGSPDTYWINQNIWQAKLKEWGL